ncbi:MAG TPA: hypothetical protein VGP17_13810 [Solirubrobacteraceae bacterium]|jgi:hypothetical protein|nr:hypothetical protein [Solirubrobacteraceae bacterium]
MTLLPEVEHALLDAIARDQAARRRTPLARIRAGSLRLPALALLALLGTTTIALAASGVILTGSNVPTHGRLRPGYGFGAPVPGGSELLPLRASDPAGGLPWGMRIVRTTRGELCVQLGRVKDSMLGELGIDGAFHDDGRFHPLPVDAILGIDCELPSQSGFSGAIIGLQPSAVGLRPSAASENVSRASLREISYGLLGEHARTIAYRSENGVKTTEVLRGLGAYLVVQRATHGGQLGEMSDSPESGGEPVDPDGTLTAITYSYGKRTCKVVGHGNALGACGFSEGPLKAKPLPVVHVPLYVQLEVHDRTVTSAYLVFRAPYPVSSAAEDYSVDSYGCSGVLTGEGVHHDVAKGAILHISIASDLSYACARSVKISVAYTRGIEDNVAVTALGKVTVQIPRGDHARPLPHSVRQRLREDERLRKRH